VIQWCVFALLQEAISLRAMGQHSDSSDAEAHCTNCVSGPPILPIQRPYSCNLVQQFKRNKKDSVYQGALTVDAVKLARQSQYPSSLCKMRSLSMETNQVDG
jgi:hypothetical protein